ncbi:MAG: NfeD family protein [Prevotella sp.]|nr:NfeD family protein [Prevotella sp.]
MIEYLKDNLWLVWTLISVLALILEVSSGTFYLLCFAIGAACAIVSSLLAIPFWIQVLVFLVFSAISVYAVRPFAVRYLHRDEDSRPSNADALIGREGLVIEPITESTPGYVRVDGDEWKAVTADGEPISNGSRVRVVARESIIVTVEKI